MYKILKNTILQNGNLEYINFLFVIDLFVTWHEQTLKWNFSKCLQFAKLQAHENVMLYSIDAVSVLSEYPATDIEGFHDAVRTPYALRPMRHVGFSWNNKICFHFVSILFEKIKLTDKWTYLHYCSYCVIRLYEV